MVLSNLHHNFDSFAVNENKIIIVLIIIITIIIII